MKKILCTIMIFVVFIPEHSYAENELSINSLIEEQKSNFKIESFIEETEKYTPEFMKDFDVNNLFESAIKGKIDNTFFLKKIINLFGIHIMDNIKVLINVLIVIIVHSILKSLTDSLENSEVSKIVYYVQYILIVTIIMSNFSTILYTIDDTIKKMVGFTQSLMPILTTLMIFTGNITTTSLIEPILLLLINFISSVVEKIVIPIISIISVMIILSKITDKVQINKLSNFMKSSIIWFLGVFLTLFIGIVSLEGNLTSSVDGITAKTTKAAVSNLIPVFGKVLGDGVDAILGSGIVLKNAIGFVGVIILIGICVVPIIKLSTFSILYSLTSSVIEPVADEKIVRLLDEMSGIFKLLLAIVCAISALLIIGIALIIKISNSGMMYR